MLTGFFYFSRLVPQAVVDAPTDAATAKWPGWSVPLQARRTRSTDNPPPTRASYLVKVVQYTHNYCYIYKGFMGFLKGN